MKKNVNTSFITGFEQLFLLEITTISGFFLFPGFFYFWFLFYFLFFLFPEIKVEIITGNRNFISGNILISGNLKPEITLLKPEITRSKVEIKKFPVKN